MKCKKFCSLLSKEQASYEKEYRKYMHETKYFAVIENGYVIGVFSEEIILPILQALDGNITVKEMKRRPCIFADVTFNFIEQ